MYGMIKRQPAELLYALQSCARGASIAREMLGSKRVYVTGCGSSFHAAIYAEYVLRANGIDACAIHALDVLHHTPRLENSAAIVISHSWKTNATLQALRVLKDRKVPCIGISANSEADVEVLLRSSSIFDESDCVTMGYSTELAAIAVLCREDQVSEVPTMLSELAGMESQIRDLVYICSDRSRFFFLGSGPDTATALEAALKMKEGNFTDAEGMQVEQMLHGSISGVDAEDAVFLIACSRSKAHKRFLDAAQALRDIGSLSVAITDSDELAEMCTHTVRIPSCEECVNPLLSIVPLQLFAYHLAASKGIDPDLTREDDPRYRNAYSRLNLHME